MDFGAMMGGDWGGGFAQGMQMAMNEKRLAMQEREAKQQAQRMKMLMEEHMLKMKEQRELREGKEKFKQMFSPQTVTKTEMNDPADPSFGMGTPIEQSVTTTQESPLMKAMRGLYGGGQADLIGSVMQASPDMGMKLMTGLKPEGINEVGLLSLPSTDPRRQNFIQGKQALQTEKSPTEIALQLRASRGDVEAQKALADLDARKASLQENKDTSIEGRLDKRMKQTEIKNLSTTIASLTKQRNSEIAMLDRRYIMEKQKLGNDIEQIGLLNQDYNESLHNIYAKYDNDIATKQSELANLKGGDGSKKTVVRTGKTKSGRRVVQYSDGTQEYAD